MYKSLDIHTKPQKIKLFITNPQQKKIGKLSEVFNINQVLKLGNINELSFSVPYEIEKDHELVPNPNIEKIKHRFYIKAQIGTYEEWYIITQIEEEMGEDSDVMLVTAKSIGYELADKLIRELELGEEANNAQQLLDIILGETLWSIGTIDEKFLKMYRGFSLSSVTVLDAVFQLAETFGAIILWDTTLRQIHFKEPANVGQNLGLKIKYGKYLKSLNKVERADEMVTRFRAFGKDNLSFHTVSPTGQNYIENFGYFIGNFERDDNGNVISHSDYMSDELCIALLDYQELLDSKEPSVKKAEYGTSPTVIKITNHGLINGDYIVNKDRDNQYRKVTVVDANTLQVDTVDNQNETDEIEMYQDGTFGKLLYRKQNEQKVKTSKENELSQLELELEILNDKLDTENALGQNTTQTQNDIADKEVEIDAKQMEIDNVQLTIDAIDSEISTFQQVVSVENNFTFEQIQERNKYIIEREWTDANYFDAKDLYDEAKNRFEEIRNPQLEIDLDVVNFLEIAEAQKDWGKLNLGDTIRIRYDKIKVNVTAKIIEVHFDYEEGTINLVIANINKISDDEALTRLINQSMSTSTTVDMSKYKWNKSDENSTRINDMLNNVWDSTKREITAGINNSIDIGKRGIRITDPNEPNKMLVAQHGLLSLTMDGGKTWKTAIRPDGIAADVVVGRLGAFVEVQANSIILSETGQGIPDDVIEGSPKWNAAEQNAKNYADGLKQTIDNNISDIDSRIISLENEVTEGFKDGIISEAEAISMGNYINQLNNEKQDIDSQYNTIISNIYLIDTTVKSNLQTSKTTFDTIHGELITLINTSIADGIGTQEEKDAIDIKFGTYRNVLGDISNKLQLAVDEIATQKSNEALIDSKGYTDDQITEVNNALDTLETSFNSTFSDTKLTNMEARLLESDFQQVKKESTDLLVVADTLGIIAEKNAYSTALNELETVLSSWINQSFYPLDINISDRNNILSKLSNVQNTKSILINKIAYEREQSAKGYTDTQVGEVNNALSNLNTSFTNAFSDDYVTSIEANQLKNNLLQVKNESTDLISIATSLAIVTETDNYSNSLVTLETELNKWINKTVYPIEITTLDRSTINSKFNDVQSYKSILINKITDVQSGKALANANEYTNGIKSTLSQEISDVDGKVDTLQQDFNNISFDGIVDEAEAMSIGANISLLNSEKADIDSRYTSIHNNVYLKTTTIKNDLATKKTAYDTAHSNLITVITNAIADDIVDDVEKLDIDTRFTEYRAALSNLTSQFEKAIDDIGTQKANEVAENSMQLNQNLNSTYITQDGIIVKNSTNTNVVQMGEFSTGKYGIRASHSDGSYTQITDNGLERYVAGELRPYQYETYIQFATTKGKWAERSTDYTGNGVTFEDWENTFQNGVWFNLPERFKGKQFNAFISLASIPVAIGDVRYGTTSIMTVAQIDRTNARLLIKAYYYENGAYNGSVYISRGLDFNIIVTL